MQSKPVPRPSCRAEASDTECILPDRKSESRCQKFELGCSTETPCAEVRNSLSPMSVEAKSHADVCFSTHDTWGILDTGATKTVIGSQHVANFLQNIRPEVKSQIQRCSCDIVFRFGNQGTLKSTQAMVVPVCGMLLKVAVVPGATPFLISNTLIRALGAMIDTEKNELVLNRHQARIPLLLSNKGLYLLDMNCLLDISSAPSGQKRVAETFAQDSFECSRTNETAVPVASKFSEDVNPKSQKHAKRVNITESSNQVLNFHGSNQTATVTVSDQIMPTSPASGPVVSEPNVSNSVSQDRNRPVDFPAVHRDHGRLVQTTPTSSSCDAHTRDGISGSSQPQRPQGGEDDVWTCTPGQDSGGSLDHGTGLDPMVPSALLRERQDGASSCDPLHSAEDRRSGGRSFDGPDSDHAQVQGCTEELHGAKGQVSTRTSERGEHGVHPCHGAGNSLDTSRRTPGDDARSQCAHGQPRECLAPDLGAPEQSSSKCGQSLVGRELPGASSSGRDGRPLESLSESRSNGDLAMFASEGKIPTMPGEFDTFCESQVNHERHRFWHMVRKIEKELRCS